MTAPMREAEAPEQDFDANVRDVIALLMPVAGLRTIKDLGEAAGIGKTAIYDRMKAAGPSFTGPELRRLAAVFDVSPQVFFDPADDLRTRIRAGSVIGRYLQSAQVRTLDLVRTDVTGQLSFDEAPRYDRPAADPIVALTRAS